MQQSIYLTPQQSKRIAQLGDVVLTQSADERNSVTITQPGAGPLTIGPDGRELEKASA